MEVLRIKDIIEELETTAPGAFQEDYDNSGLIIGNMNTEVSKALVCLDCTEEIIDEAIAKNCNLVIAHHPIIFRGLKRLNGNTYVERTIIKALKNDIAIYAIHTNLDNVLQNGVNTKIAEKLKLEKLKILDSKSDKLAKLVTFVPRDNAQIVREALFNAGAGKIGNYDSCSFNTEGKGTFKGNENSNPFAGMRNELHTESETRIETIFPIHIKSKIISSLIAAHPYEEVAYDIVLLENDWLEVGSGIVGELKEEMKSSDFLKLLKKNLNLNVVKYTDYTKPIKKVAICGGSGSFLLSKALKVEADVFVTSDFKYHEFFDAEGKIMICDVGHYESEQFTPELIIEIIQKKFANFAAVLTETNTNPVNYYY
jgi:dinuclear metal center YbgI/SA1388 family protein